MVLSLIFVILIHQILHFMSPNDWNPCWLKLQILIILIHCIIILNKNMVLIQFLWRNIVKVGGSYVQSKDPYFDPLFHLQNYEKGLPANMSRNFFKHSRFTNCEGQYVEEPKWGFQYVEEFKSSTYWLVFLDLLANHWIYQ